MAGVPQSDNTTSQKSSLAQVERMQAEIDEVTDQVAKNVDILMKRGLDVNNLTESCTYFDQLEQQFEVTARRVKYKYYMKNKKKCILLIVILLTLFLVIVSIILVYLFVIKS